MEEIYKNCYVGGDEDYNNLKDKIDLRKRFGLGEGKWSFLRCCKYGPGGHHQTLGYHTLAAPEGSEHFVVKRPHHMALNMLDLDDPHYVDKDMVLTGLDFAFTELLSGRKLLIACNAGRSRGPTMGLMFLRYIGAMPHAYLLSQRFYHNMYPMFNPKQGIDQFARTHWAELRRI